MRSARSDAPRSGRKSPNHRQSCARKRILRVCHCASLKFQTLRGRLECARRLGVLNETRTSE
eukprot:11026814-Alexandrium_andersonii.AAC.1